METFWLTVAFIGIVLLALVSKLGPPVGPVHRSGIKAALQQLPNFEIQFQHRRMTRGHKFMALRSILGATFLATALAFPALADRNSGTPQFGLGQLTMALTQTQHGDAAISLQELAADNAVAKRARRLYEKALESDRKGRTNLALEQARAALDAFPGYFQAEAALAVAYLKQGNASEAQRHVRIAAKLDPHYLPAQEIRGLVFYFQGRIREAADTLGEVVKTAPCRKAAHYYLSLALRQLGAYQEADYHLLTAQELDAQELERDPILSGPKDPAAWDGSEFLRHPRRH